MHIDAPVLSDVSALRALWKEAFEDSDAFLDTFFSSAFSPQHCRCVFLQGQIGAMLYWFDCQCGGEKLAYLYAVATAKTFRGKGLCHALMEGTQLLLAEQGYAGVILVPGEQTLFGFYEKMGYSTFGGIREFSCTTGSHAATLRPIDVEEYAQLRRAYLPKGSVLQEGQTLTFLQTQAQFYAGDDFILVATKEGNRIFIPELLGNSAAAPNIVCALGVEKGDFRTPGNQSFAMYHPLSQTQPPAYFGLALD